MRRADRQKNSPELVGAAEIASWAYCPEQFRLQYGLGLKPANREALDAGTRSHVRKAVAERTTSSS